jgi:DNA repair exonuclease SbcCD nuclease subunit
MKIRNKTIGCFSDIHLGIAQDSKEWHNIALDFAKWASKLYKDRDIEDIIIPGDIFHNRSHISVETLSIAKQFFDYFKDFNIYISAGNHDCFKKDKSDINSISILDGWNNIKIIDKEPITIETNYSKNITLVPWGVSLDDISKSDIIFGHFEIDSFYMNSYKLCEHGFSYKDLFKIAPTIISGHFHKKDHRKYEKGQIVYLGSPYQHNFGDVKDERGIYIFNIETEDFEFIENTISPKHYKISIDENFDEDIIKNNFISLIVDNQADENQIIEFKGKLLNLNPKNIRIDYNENDSKIEVFDENKELGTSDLIKSIEEYIETLNPENKKEVVEYIKEMYNSLI